MNGKFALGPYISAEDLNNLPEEKKEKYSKEKLEDSIIKRQNELYKMFCGGGVRYANILYDFNKYAGESDVIRDGMLKNEKITEIMEAVLYIMASEKHVFVSKIEAMNKAIEIVFKSDFSKDPWRGKLLSCVGNNPIDIGKADSLVEFFKRLNIPEEEYKIALEKSLKKTEIQRGISGEILIARKKLGLEIEAESLQNYLGTADEYLKRMVFSRAVEMYEALKKVNFYIGAERNNIVFIYRFDCENSRKNELIKNIAMDAGIISKPKKPEESEKLETADTRKKEKKPWWKFW